MNPQNRYMDFDRSKNLSRLSGQYAGRRGLIIQIIVGLIVFISGGLPVIYRLLFRVRIGILTLTPISVIMGALFSYYLLNTVNWAAPLHTDTQDLWTLKSLSLGTYVGVYVLVRGLYILWWQAPSRIRRGLEHNPLSLGLAWVNIHVIDEYAPQHWHGQKRAPLFYERIEGPRRMLGVGLVIWGIGYLLIDPPYQDNFLQVGGFLMIISAAALIEAWMLERQFLNGKVAQLANQSWARHIASKFEDPKNKKMVQESGQNVRYGGSR